MKRPQVHIWTGIYFAMGTLPLLLMCFWSIADGWFPSEPVLAKHPDPADNFYLFNKSLAYATALLTLLSSAPFWILVLGKKKSWIWMTLLVFIALGISGNPLFGIPILIFWLKDNNKAYYGKLDRV
ncbi:hypothetical protein P4C99_20000 [Pontiellaceae bacterium B1224]|nr:hypothetical protein [Pontiellaceae bacterium B1224]